MVQGPLTRASLQKAAMGNAPIRIFRKMHDLPPIARHQLVALVATVADYIVMITGVAAFGLPPSAATAVGALGGGALGFALARTWVFRATSGARHVQAAAYASVWLVSLLANAGGEAAFVRAGLNYVAARVIVSLVVGLAWNFPMQRRFVFVRR